MGLSLYEIENAILDCVDMETGEIVDVEKLEQLQLERDTKVENIALWIKNLNAEAAAIKVEADNLARRKKAAENKAESLKRYLTGYLQGEKFKTARVSISYRASESVEIAENTDLSKLGEEFTTVEIKPAKMAIKEALKAGKEIEGCALVTKNNLQIR